MQHQEPNKTDAGNGSDGTCRVIDAPRSPSPDPGRSVKAMKSAALLIITILLSSCSTLVMKHAHVIPIYDGQILLSAHPEFIGPGGSLYDDPHFARPEIWSYEKLRDGSTMVHWVSRLSAHERLVFMDSGFHPIVVPPEAISIVAEADHEISDRKPTVIRIQGTNTAFVPDAVTLIPYRP